MVRLGESCIFKKIAFRLFQFHHGTIGSWDSTGNREIQLCNFNSTMVRLGEQQIRCHRLIDIDFNSTMVRLGALRTQLLYLHQAYFNSTMVRLGVCPIFSRYDKLKISIPPWYDWEQQPRFRALHFYHFNSTMVRLGVHKKYFALIKCSVSIPPWYDWEPYI